MASGWFGLILADGGMGMNRIIYDRRGRLRVCGRLLESERLCLGPPGHSGLHGMSGGHAEWILEKGEYESFKEGEHERMGE